MESLSIDGDLPPLAFNARYLADGLRGFDDPEVTICANGATTPVVIGQTYLVMPVQIRQ